MEIERNADVFTNSPVTVVGQPVPTDASEEPPVKTLIQMDGDEHKANRGIVNDWFKPGNVKRCRSASTSWRSTTSTRWRRSAGAATSSTTSPSTSRCR